MISSQQVSNRIAQMLEHLFLTNSLDYGFSSTKGKRFIPENQNNATTPKVKTVLYFRYVPLSTIGNPISSMTKTFNRTNSKEIITEYKNIEITINILSKTRGHAKDAINFLLMAIQSDRKTNACYDSSLDFNLILYNSSEVRDLTEMENSTWTERQEISLFCTYKSDTNIDDALFTDVPDSLEETKDVIQFETELKI